MGKSESYRDKFTSAASSVPAVSGASAELQEDALDQLRVLPVSERRWRDIQTHPELPETGESLPSFRVPRMGPPQSGGERVSDPVPLAGSVFVSGLQGSQSTPVPEPQREDEKRMSSYEDRRRRTTTPRLWMISRVCTGPTKDPAPEVTDGISFTDPQDEERPQMDRDMQENPPTGSRWLPQDKLKGPLTSPDVNLTDGLPCSSKMGDCTESMADPISCVIKQVSEIGPKTSPRNKRSIVTSQEGNTLKRQSGDPGHLCGDTKCGGLGYRGKTKPDGSGVTPGFILVCEATEQKLLGHHNYSKLSYSPPTLDNTTACAGAPGDLGAILWVQHRLLLATDGSATAFRDSVIYTSEMDIPACAEGTAEDLFFLTFNMSHKEIWYGRQCHSCLTSIILDCIRRKTPKHLLCKVMRLLSMYWVSLQDVALSRW
ncbi:unnamed protein product [Ranitomeya imitator]|uniref:Uncharacterized protein n=1 Tax=Ranitomeya imitator TaxID=111125 RepID=A0ABN9L745_9NEOB|nr:unnamed protein product [Ranitomeya imitator]